VAEGDADAEDVCIITNWAQRAGEGRQTKTKTLSSRKSWATTATRAAARWFASRQQTPDGVLALARRALTALLMPAYLRDTPAALRISAVASVAFPLLTAALNLSTRSGARKSRHRGISAPPSLRG